MDRLESADVEASELLLCGVESDLINAVLSNYSNCLKKIDTFSAVLHSIQLWMVPNKGTSFIRIAFVKVKCESFTQQNLLSWKFVLGRDGSFCVFSRPKEGKLCDRDMEKNC